MNIRKLVEELDTVLSTALPNFQTLTELEYVNTVEEKDNKTIITLTNDRTVEITKNSFPDDKTTYIILNTESGKAMVVENTDPADFILHVAKQVCEETYKYEAPKKERLELQTDFSNGVSVSSEEAATNFVNLHFLELKDIDKVKAELQELLALCKENKITVKNRKNAKEILNTYPAYKESIETYNDGVKELQELWKKIVEEGIYTGFVDDERINAAHQKRFELEKLLYADTIISKFSNEVTRIEEILEEIKYGTKYTMISL